ncbi:MAG: C25 family cysteine peptidase, partial [Candidatus Hadarchaeales archaeon]
VLVWSGNTWTKPGPGYEDGTYYWSVWAIDNIGTENKAENTWQFTISTVLKTPTLLLPENGSYLSTRTPYFTWEDPGYEYPAGSNSEPATSSLNTTPQSELLLAMGTRFQTVIQTVTFEAPSVQKIGDYDLISINGCGFLSNIGEPMLPVKGLLIELPSADIVEVKFTSPDNMLLPGNYFIYPAQPPRPLLNGGGEFVRPSQEIYSSDAWYPGRMGELMYISSSKSKPLAYVRIFPLQYLPAENRVVYYQQVSVEVTVSVQPAMAPLPLSPGLRVDYLIITRPIFLGTLENFVAWKQSKGLTVAVETVDNIVNTFSGRDIPEKIRNCINQYYTDNKIKWVLLVGDADNDDGPLVGGMPSYSLDKDWEVPTRYVWNKDPSDEGGWISMDPDWTPTDYYYAGLDGDWDQDADNYFGENAQRNANGVDEADWFAEVYVGRIPIRTTSELSAILAKIINFKESSIPSRNFLLYGAEMGPDWENGRNKKFKEDLKENYLPASLNFHSRYEIDGNLSFNDVNSDINSY